MVFDPAAFAQRQLDAYNAKDLAAFIAEYTDDVVVHRLPDSSPVLVGKPALAAHYRDNRFNLPNLHAEVINRMVMGNKVVDHELITGLAESPIQAIAIYEVTEKGIGKVWFLSPG